MPALLGLDVLAEIDVVELAHLPNRVIAELRGSRTATVKAQMRSALVKLGANSRTAAARTANVEAGNLASATGGGRITLTVRAWLPWLLWMLTA
mgnify:CR=1 FL=1